MDENFKKRIVEVLNFIIKPIIGEEPEYEFLKEGDQWRVNIRTERIQKITGSHSEILNSLQHISRVVVHKDLPNDRTHFLLDVNLYRRRRESYITEKIPQTAEIDVLKKGETIVVCSLTSYERKMIHQMLSEVNGLETTSVGEGFNRRLIIRPTFESSSIQSGIEKSKIIDINKEIV